MFSCSYLYLQLLLDNLLNNSSFDMSEDEFVDSCDAWRHLLEKEKEEATWGEILDN